ncbi:MAG: hypothetical protein M1268_03515 [Patescibacteria group bacterium]|nr:hypothetical protein [Patescibacteria group bacterium]
MKKNRKKIAILCDMGSFANSIRPLEIKKYLRAYGHNVVIINNKHLYQGIKNRKDNKFSFFIKQRLLNKLNKLAIEFVDKKINGWPYYCYLILKLKIRSLVLTRIIKREKFDVIICENHLHAFVIKKDLQALTILDLDSPYIDELFYSEKINKGQRMRLNKKFKKIYQNADYVNFQWHRYTDYVKKNIYNGNNIIEINFGCQRRLICKKVKYNTQPRIICLGYLGGKWVNLPLLSKLSKLYPIDVYGGPVPDKKWGLNYKGYAPSTDVLKNYQFGLITISKDKLRQSSFSSKHLEYLSYGLPVLTPEWRKDHLLENVSIYFNEDNFLNVLKKYSDPDTWQKMSDACFRQAQAWEWKNVLKPLGNIVDNSSMEEK